jgi:hypothetical protein
VTETLSFVPGNRYVEFDAASSNPLLVRFLLDSKAARSIAFIDEFMGEANPPSNASTTPSTEEFALLPTTATVEFAGISALPFQPTGRLWDWFKTSRRTSRGESGDATIAISSGSTAVSSGATVLSSGTTVVSSGATVASSGGWVGSNSAYLVSAGTSFAIPNAGSIDSSIQITDAASIGTSIRHLDAGVAGSAYSSSHLLRSARSDLYAWRLIRGKVARERAVEQLQQTRRAATELSRIAEAILSAEGNDDIDIGVTLEDFLARHGRAGIRTISAYVFNSGVNSEIASALLLSLARNQNEATLTLRREILTAALQSSDPALRYSAAIALGEFGHENGIMALQQRLVHEKNRTIAAMIRAQLR